MTCVRNILSWFSRNENLQHNKEEGEEQRRKGEPIGNFIHALLVIYIDIYNILSNRKDPRDILL